MPIPAPERYRRSNLTKQQKQEELREIYGVKMDNSITAADIRRMKALVAEHEAKEAEEGDFDPSKVRAPYRFQKFPMMVYNHEESFPAHTEDQTHVRGSMVVTEVVNVSAHLAKKVVHSQAELDHALAKGWSENPPEFRDDYDGELEPILAGEAAAADAALRPKRGRPRTLRG